MGEKFGPSDTAEQEKWLKEETEKENPENASEWIYIYGPETEC